MNKDLLNQLPTDEQPVASELTTAAESMQLSPDFAWKLETRLMDTAKKKTLPHRNTKFAASLGWMAFAIGAVFLLNWIIRSLPSNPPVATEGVPDPVLAFEAEVRQGRICGGPLALAHDFSVSLTNPDKSGFITVDKEKTIAELRAFAWSPDGKQLAIAGNVPGNIYLTDSTGSRLQPILPGSEIEYPAGIAWSHDGQRLLAWSIPNTSMIYLMNADGTGLTEMDLAGMQFSGTPQFAPDDNSIVFHGFNSSAFGLFQMTLDTSEIRLITSQAADGNSFAWSPDGLHLAYIEIEQGLGKARLVLEEVGTGSKDILTSWDIQENLSIAPASVHLSWSSDGKSLVFQNDDESSKPSIYLIQIDGTSSIKLVDAAYKPAISADGRCLAYIRDKQVFLMDLNNTASTPVLISDLPAGQQRGTTDPELDDLQWSPSPVAVTETSPTPEVSFEADIHQGRICTEPLAIAHDSSVFLTNPDKTGFTAMDVGQSVDELHTFAWSPDGEQLAIVANQKERGYIYVKDFDKQLEYVLPTPDLGYLMDVAWSWDGKRLLARSIKSRSAIYLMNADGTGLVETKELEAQFFETPQFTPDDKSLVFHGVDTFSFGQHSEEMGGLIQLQLDSLELTKVGMALPMQAERSFAWSPDGSHLAYLEALGNGLLQLVMEDVLKEDRVILASLPNPEETFGSMPINMSWSPDGKKVVFEFGSDDSKRAIYLVNADGSGLVKLADSAYAPAISADGRCLAYISNQQVFLMDLAGAASTSVRVADLPPGRQTTYPRLDKLQWRP